VTAVIQFAPETPTRTTRKREAGTYSLMETPVIDFQKRHGSATSRTLTALAERANYTQKPPMSVAEIQVETELGQRAVEKALATLESLGFCGRVGRLWKYTNPSDPNVGANTDANGNANSRSHGRSQNGQKNAVPHEEKQPLKEVEGSRRKYKLATGAEWIRWAGSRTPNPNTQTPDPADAGSADAPPQASPSQEPLKDPKATPEAERSQGGSESLAPAATPHRAEHHGDDHDAVEFFLALAGYNFVTANRLHLARWAESYTPDFLRLAWKLAPTVANVRVAGYAMVFLLNREREWPDALKAQYGQDVAPPAQQVSAREVQVGDRLRWPDGGTATVIDLHSTQLLTDAEDDARAYVRYDQIGQGVEVLR